MLKKRPKNIIYGKSDTSSPQPTSESSTISANLTTKSSSIFSPPRKLNGIRPLEHREKSTQEPIAKRPCLAVQGESKEAEGSADAQILFFEVLWATNTSKMHKTYDNGYLKVNIPPRDTTESTKRDKTIGNRSQFERSLILYDSSKSVLHQSTSGSIKYSDQKLTELKEEDKLNISDKIIIIQSRIPSVASLAPNGTASDVDGSNEDNQATKSTNFDIPKPRKTPMAVPTKPVKHFAVPKSSLPLQVQASSSAGSSASNVKKDIQFNPYITNDKDRVVLCQKSSELGFEHEVELESFLRTVMMPHQIEAVNFLFHACFSNQKRIPPLNDDNGVEGTDWKESRGAVLADSMGLGKTLTSIALIRTVLTQSQWKGPKFPLVRKLMVACPSSLVLSWSKEIERWLGKARLDPLVISDKTHQGSVAEQKSLIHSFAAEGTSKKVIIISYDQIKVHQEELSKVKFGLLIADEGHKLKNPSSQIYQILLNELEVERRIILTGTPFQNSHAEVWALLNFVNPSCLGPPNGFKSIFYDLTSEDQMQIDLRNHQSRDEDSVPTKLGIKSSNLGKIMKSMILRRTQADIASMEDDESSNAGKNKMPAKTETVLFIKPSDIQIKATQSILKGCNPTNHDIDEMDCDFDNSVISDTEEDGTDQDVADSLESLGSEHGALAMVTQAQNITSHPLLAAIRSDSSVQLSDIEQIRGYLRNPSKKGNAYQVANTILQDISSDQTQSLSSSLIAMSSKFLILSHVISSLKKSNALSSSSVDKIVIASSSTRTLDLIQSLILSEHDINVSQFSRIDGSTPVHDRQMLIQKFSSNSSCWIMLLSTKAGGQGLNLQAANRLILFDSNWNPAFDEQAMARIWRPGQKKPCFIYRFVTTGTIDERILQSQIAKTSISSLIFGNGNSDEYSNTDNNSGKSRKPSKSIQSLTSSPLSSLLKLDLDTSCQTHDISNCNQSNCTTANVKQRQSSHENAIQIDIEQWSHIRLGSKNLTTNDLDDNMLVNILNASNSGSNSACASFLLFKRFTSKS